MFPEDTTYAFAGKVRLAGKTEYTGTGRVEVYCNGEWGLVCNTGFNSNDANTVCRQLGYTVANDHGGNYGYVLLLSVLKLVKQSHVYF